MSSQSGAQHGSRARQAGARRRPVERRRDETGDGVCRCGRRRHADDDDDAAADECLQSAAAGDAAGADAAVRVTEHDGAVADQQ